MFLSSSWGASARSTSWSASSARWRRQTLVNGSKRAPSVLTRVFVFFTQKGYLIIIIISPKYYETVTASPLLENDERTFNTVYIHKQVCSHRGWIVHLSIWPLFIFARLCDAAPDWVHPEWEQEFQVHSHPVPRGYEGKLWAPPQERGGHAAVAVLPSLLAVLQRCPHTRPVLLSATSPAGFRTRTSTGGPETGRIFCAGWWGSRSTTRPLSGRSPPSFPFPSKDIWPEPKRNPAVHAIKWREESDLWHEYRILWPASLIHWRFRV